MIINRGVQLNQKKGETQIFSCSGCYQMCKLQHKIKEKHATIQMKNIQTKLDHFMYSQDQKWENIIIEMTSKVEVIKQFIKKIENSLFQQIIQEKMIYTLNISHQSANDQSNVLSAVKQIMERNYTNLSCDQVSKVSQILQNKSLKRPNISGVLNKIELNTSNQIMNFVYKQFPKMKVQNVRSLQRQGQVNKHKIQVNQRPNRAEYNQRRNQRDQKNNRNQRIQRNQRNQYNQRNQRNQPKYSDNRRQPRQNKLQNRQHPLKCEKNQFPLIKINQIQTFKGNFNIAVKVLAIQKVFSVGKRELVEFIGGDQTGIATCVFNNSQFIKQDQVLSISKCRIYIFHGTKQLQNSDQSEVFQEDFQINKINRGYNLSVRKNRDRRQQKNDNQKKPYRRQYRRPERANQRQNNQERNKMPRTATRRYNQQPLKREQNKVFPHFSNNNKKRNNYSDSEDEKEPATKQIINSKYTKISQIGPGDENLNIMAEVVQIQIVNGQLLCLLGDSSAVIKARFSQKHKQLQKGKVFQFLNIDSILVKDKILLDLNKAGQIILTTLRLPNVNIKYNISNIEWEQKSDDEKQQYQQNDSTFLEKKGGFNSDEDLIDF